MEEIRERRTEYRRGRGREQGEGGEAQMFQGMAERSKQEMENSRKKEWRREGRGELSTEETRMEKGRQRGRSKDNLSDGREEEKGKRE